MVENPSNNPLAYLGVKAPTPPNLVRFRRAPTPRDTGFDVGTIWLDEITGTNYSLGIVAGGLAVWDPYAGSTAGVDTLTGDTGGAISPSGANINILGGSGLTVDGAGSTLTINNKIDNFSAYLYVVGFTGNSGYTTVQAALDAIGPGGSGQIFLQPGTYTENLTFPDGIDVGIITGSDEDAAAAEIVGAHIPPTTGNVVLWRVKMTSPSDLFNSAAAGSATLSLVHNNYSVNGYLWNVPNWTGALVAGLIADRASASSGIVNNVTGTSPVFLFSNDLGVGSANPGFINGFCEIQQCGIGCPITYGGSSSIIFARNIFTATQTFTDSIGGGIHNSYFSTGSDAALEYETSGDVVLSDCTITSTNNPAIDGSGAGTLIIGAVAFTSDNNISASLTLSKGTLNTGTLQADQLQIEGGAVTDFIGQATLVAGTVTVANTNILATDRIFISRSALNGSADIGTYTTSIIASTSFTITSNNATAGVEAADVSTIDYFIVREL